MAHHLAMLGGDQRARVTSWLSLWAPWMPADEVMRLVDAVTTKTLRWRADTLAARLGLTEAVRTRLRITTIGAIDLTKGEREEARKARKRQAERGRSDASRARSRATNTSPSPRGAPSHGKPKASAGALGIAAKPSDTPPPICWCQTCAIRRGTSVAAAYCVCICCVSDLCHRTRREKERGSAKGECVGDSRPKTSRQIRLSLPRASLQTAALAMSHPRLFWRPVARQVRKLSPPPNELGQPILIEDRHRLLGKFENIPILRLTDRRLPNRGER